MQIKDFINRIYEPINVINGSAIICNKDLSNPEELKTKDDMLNNILQIHLSEDLVENTMKFLSRILSIYNLPGGRMGADKPGTLIYGAYSCGKSHFMTYLSILCGLEVEFSDPEKSHINIKEECWKILEDKIGSEEIKRFESLKNEKFLVYIYSLISAEAGKDFRHIIINSFNRALDYNNIRDKVAVNPIDALDKLEIETYEKLMEKYYPDLKKEYRNTEDIEKKNNLIKTVQQRRGMIKQNLGNDDIAEEMRTILNKNKIKGVVLFFDEFFRYYKPLSDDNKKITGSYLQNFGYELQNILKIPIILISQVELMSSDRFLQQVEDRFARVPLKHSESAPIIQKRIIPDREVEKISNYYSLFKSKRPHLVLSKEEFINNYPFHPKTIKELEARIGDFANEQRGVMTYAVTALKNHREDNADELISADTLLDRIIMAIINPADRGYNLKKVYENIAQIDNFFDSLSETTLEEKMLMEKIFKIILFCTSPTHPWTYEDFFNHFYDIDSDHLREILDNFYDKLRDNYQLITKTLNQKAFFYSEGTTGDVTIYVNKVIKCLNKEECLRKQFEVNCGSIANGFKCLQGKIKKFVKWFFSGDSTELLEKINQEKILESLIKKPKNTKSLKSEEIENHLIDAIVIIDNLYYNDLNKIQEILKNGFDNLQVDEEFKEIFQLSILKKCIFYILPSSLNKTTQDSIIAYFSQKISLIIFENLKNEQLEWKFHKNQLKHEDFNRLFDETQLMDVFKDFKKEDPRMYSSLIKTLKEEIDKFENSEEINLYNNVKNGKILYNLTTWEEISIIQPNDNWENIFEYCFNKFFKEKYPILNKLNIKNTYLPPSATTWFNKLLKNFFYDDTTHDYNIIDSSINNLYQNEIKSFGLISFLKKDKFVFKKDFSVDNDYFKLFNKLDSNPEGKYISFSEALTEYLCPPYGFPFRLTAILLLSLIHSEKKILIAPDGSNIQILSVSKDNFNPKGKDFKIDNINKYLDYYFANGDILEENYFKELKMYFNVIFSGDNWEDESWKGSDTSLVDKDISENFKKIYKTNSLTSRSQEMLTSMIKNSKLDGVFQKYEQNIKNFHSKLVEISELAVNKKSEDIADEIFSFIIRDEKTDLISLKKNISSLLKLFYKENDITNKEYLKRVITDIRKFFLDKEINEVDKEFENNILEILNNLRNLWNRIISIKFYFKTQFVKVENNE